MYAAAAQLRKEMEGLVASPLNDPTVGPALLTGRAAAVFFHEVFGHRAEGHRQKDVNEGQTFAKKVGEPILPEFLSIVDDPTMKKLGNQDLLGYYQFDDEGVTAQHVTLVDHGVLKNFEMSRSPLVGFPHSNGHGRRQIGATPVSRQGNLIVESNKTVTNAQFRAKLIELIKQQDKPYGLLIDDIAGGFTFTGRGQPQAFQVEPLVVYKVFPDGRPDELVRGVDIVGTPLAALTKIVATGDTPEVFNGYCGAESGYVPVSAAAPAILTSGNWKFRKRKHPRTGRPFCRRPRTTLRNREAFSNAFPSSLGYSLRPFDGDRRLCSGPAENDHTLQAMRDEMARAKSRLELAIPPSNQPVRPYYIEYRLLDMDIRQIVGEFGALVSATHTRTRVMDVGARVGNYKSTAPISSARTDSADSSGPPERSASTATTTHFARIYGSPPTRPSRKLSKVTPASRPISAASRAPRTLTISRVQAIQHVDPLIDSDWSSRNWEQEARDTSAALRPFAQIYESRVTYYLVYLTEYLLTSEGTEVRTNHSFAAIEAGMNTLADDGMQVNHLYSSYAPRPADLPSVDAVRKAFNVAGSELMAMRAAPPASDYTGPVLFEPRAAAALLAQVLGPSLNRSSPSGRLSTGCGSTDEQPGSAQRLEWQG